MMRQKNKGVTLVEILLACILMAGAFLPVMGVLSSSYKITDKDASTQTGVAVCQEKLNKVLQFPYDKFPEGTEIVGEFKSDNTENTVILKLGDEDNADNINGVKYVSTLKVAYESITFHNIYLCDFNVKLEKPDNPELWLKKYSNFEIPASTHRIKRYTVTTVWTDRGGKTSKSYSLSALKTDIRG